MLFLSQCPVWHRKRKNVACFGHFGKYQVWNQIMLKVTKADESDLYNIIIRAKSHDLIYDQGKLQHWNLQQIRVIIVIDLKALKTRDCWNIVVMQGLIPWFDLWAGSGPWGKSSTGGWLGREAIFICCDATEETEPEFSVAGNTMQIWWENNHWLVNTDSLGKQKACCVFYERETLPFNN